MTSTIRARVVRGQFVEENTHTNYHRFHQLYLKNLVFNEGGQDEMRKSKGRVLRVTKSAARRYLPSFRVHTLGIAVTSSYVQAGTNVRREADVSVQTRLHHIPQYAHQIGILQCRCHTFLVC